MPPLLRITDLRIDLGDDRSRVRVVDGVSLTVDRGEVVCLVGESGCGKSVTALSITRSIPDARIAGGRIELSGRDVAAMSDEELRRARGGLVGHVFQDAPASLSPLMTVGGQLREAMTAHRRVPDAVGEAARLLRRVGVADPERRLEEHPHRLSGGMQQRVMIALALASLPGLLVADEPTTALDTLVQAQVLELFRTLRDTEGLGVLLITHNLGVVAGLADRVAVMYAGQVVESGPTAEVLAAPAHPYTRALLRAMPGPRAGSGHGRLESIPGAVPSPGRWPAGCRFAPRCPVARPACPAVSPTPMELPGGRSTLCPYESGTPSPACTGRAA